MGKRDIEPLKTYSKIISRKSAILYCILGKGRASTAGVDPQTLKVRKALAEKLKQEVIGRH